MRRCGRECSCTREETAKQLGEGNDRPEPGIAYAIARLQQRILAGVTERVAPYGLTTLQFTTLAC